MSAVIPKKRRFRFINSYVDLDSPRVIAYGNPTRGVFLLTITDSFDATRPRIWNILVDGGTAFVGDGAKYFLIDNSGFNVASFTPVTFGYTYNLTDAFGNTYLLTFNGARGFDCTIQRTAGASLTGPIHVETLLFVFDDPNK